MKSSGYKIVSERTNQGYECAEHPDGSKAWYLNGNRHREDGPAVEYTNGSRYWWLNGKLHREDGPAVEHSDGSKHWFLNDEQISLEMKSDDPKVKILQEYMKLSVILES
jgi:hypothetical protein